MISQVPKSQNNANNPQKSHSYKYSSRHTGAYNIPSDMDYLHTSSNQEFTGLIPAGTAEEEDLISYSEIFPFYEKIPPK